MAVDSGTIEIMKSRGITPIPLETGTKIMKKVFCSDINGEVIVTGERGSAGEDPFLKAYPIVDRIETRDRTTTGVRMISRSKDLYIDNHRFRNVPLVPGVMGIEAAAQKCIPPINRQRCRGVHKCQFYICHKASEQR